MFTDLNACLTRLLPTTQVNLFLRSYDYLYRLHGENLLSILPRLIKQISERESYTAIPFLYDTTLDYLDEGLKRFGLILNLDDIEYTELDNINDLLGLFLEIESYDDLPSIINLIETSNNEIDLVSTLTQTINATLTDYRSMIESINDNVVNNLYTIVKNYLSDSDTEDKIVIRDNPLLKTFIQRGYIENVDPRIKSILAKRPYSLNTASILRSFGNMMADNPQGEYDWVFTTLVSSDYLYEEGEDNLDELFGKWGRHFVEEKDLLQMAYKVKQLYLSLLEESNDA